MINCRKKLDRGNKSSFFTSLPHSQLGSLCHHFAKTQFPPCALKYQASVLRFTHTEGHSEISLLLNGGLKQRKKCVYKYGSCVEDSLSHTMTTKKWATISWGASLSSNDKLLIFSLSTGPFGVVNMPYLLFIPKGLFVQCCLWTNLWLFYQYLPFSPIYLASM